MQMLNVFEPKACERLIPAWPARAVSTDAYRLGNEVPTAPSVRPITVSETPRAQPMRSSARFIRKARIESHAVARTRVST